MMKINLLKPMGEPKSLAQLCHESYGFSYDWSQLPRWLRVVIVLLIIIVVILIVPWIFIGILYILDPIFRYVLWVGSHAPPPIR